MVCSASSGELDAAEEGERVQARARATARSGVVPVMAMRPRLPTRFTCIPYFGGSWTDRVFRDRYSGGL